MNAAGQLNEAWAVVLDEVPVEVWGLLLQDEASKDKEDEKDVKEEAEEVEEEEEKDDEDEEKDNDGALLTLLFQQSVFSSGGDSS